MLPQGSIARQMLRVGVVQALRRDILHRVAPEPHLSHLPRLPCLLRLLPHGDRVLVVVDGVVFHDVAAKQITSKLGLLWVEIKLKKIESLSIFQDI